MLPTYPEVFFEYRNLKINGNIESCTDEDAELQIFLLFAGVLQTYCDLELTRTECSQRC